MPLQSSGAISLNDVQTEFGGSNPIEIDEYYRGGSNVPDTTANASIPQSGTIAMDDFYGGDSTPAGGTDLFTFTSFTFTNAGQTGYSGPSLTQCQTAYSGEPWLSSYFTTNSGEQRWTVPATGSYLFEVEGAIGGDNGYNSGSNYNPGVGRRVTGEISLTKNDVIAMRIGQKGTDANSSCNGAGGGGGGATYIYNITTSTLLFVAGGGGGSGTNSNADKDAQSGTSGGDAQGVATVPGGTNGGGGTGASDTTHGCVAGGGGGGGYTSDGVAASITDGAQGFPGKGYNNGSNGGTNSSRRDGGFGGGGTSGQYCGGGAGGYSGGAGGGLPSCSCSSLKSGGGGGSYIDSNASSTTNTLSTSGSHGSCKITKLVLSYTFSGNPTAVEGSSYTGTVNTIQVSNGTTLYWTINHGTTSAADFSATSGSFTISASGNMGSGSFSFTPTASDADSSSETFSIEIRTGSTSGTIVDTSSTITLNETAAAGQAAYTTPGTYSWTCPSGVTSVCVVCIGGGGGGMYYFTGSYHMSGGAGGGLGYKNNISVTPGQSYTVVVGDGGLAGYYSAGSTAGGDSYFINATTVKGGGGNAGRYSGSAPSTGGNFVGDGGGNGGGVYVSGSSGSGPQGGGGAGGYSGDGGRGGQNVSGRYPTSGSGGSACGGGNNANTDTKGYGGGGVDIFGEGSSFFAVTNGPGKGGSGGGDGYAGPGRTTASNTAANPVDGTVARTGGNYGGGGGGGTDNKGGNGGGGAVRIIWGSGRSFPSTNTADV